MSLNIPTISIIVPVYNVKEYIETCVNSILNQTFSDFELILVDDGSTDGSGELCEQLCHRDMRLICLHKNNGGLSDARNYGIDQMKGQYVTFIDSDDWVEPTYLEYLYRNICSDVDISTCVYVCCGNGSRRPWKTLPDEPDIMCTKDALLSLLYDEKINVSAHGKLYRSTLFKEVRFPFGKHYEDVGTTYKLIQRARSVSIGGSQLYNYRMRPESITHSNDNKIFDRYELALQAYQELSEGDSEVSKAAERYYIAHSLSVLHDCDLQNDMQLDIAKKIRQRILKHIKSINDNARVRDRDKAAINILQLGIQIYQISWILYSVLTGRKRIF